MPAVSDRFRYLLPETTPESAFPRQATKLWLQFIAVFSVKLYSHYTHIS